MTEPAQKPGRQPKPCDACQKPVDYVPRAGKQRRFCNICQLVHDREQGRAHDRKRGWRRPNSDPNKTKARAQRWYTKNRNTERAKMLERYYAAAEARRAKSRAWKLANPERNADIYAAWAKNNRPYLNLLGQKRRARLRDNHSPGVSEAQWEAIWDWFGGKCAYCLGPAREIEHLIPISGGGRDEPSNVVPACKRCNTSKGKKPLLQWLLCGGAQ